MALRCVVLHNSCHGSPASTEAVQEHVRGSTPYPMDLPMSLGTALAKLLAMGYCVGVTLAQ